MAFHGWLFVIHQLDETNHGLLAIGIEAAIIACMQVCLHQVLPIFERVGRQFLFGIVSKVGDESLTVLKLNFDWLVVNSTPFSINCGSVYLSCCFVSILKVDFDLLLIFELPLMFLTNHLNSIWHVMSTHVLYVKQIHCFSVLTDEESPLTVDTLSKAVHWLICFDLGHAQQSHNWLKFHEYIK